MSIIVVQDANVFIDLQAGHVLESALKLDCEFHTTDTVLDEVEERLDAFVKNGLINVKILSGEEFIEIAMLRSRQPRKISMEDCSLLLMAARLENAVLMTGDGNLRFCAEKAKIEVHGTLWIMDTLISSGLLTPKQAAVALLKMIKAHRRLPSVECNERLKRWGS